MIGGPKQGEKASDYFKKQLREGRIFVGFDCDDDGLGTAVNKGGTAIISFRQRLSPRSLRRGKMPS